MDSELARTFLAVVATGSFVNAAARLHVTQSTVSARIHALERTLGCVLFVRNRGGTTLTAAGRRFQRHATTLVRTVEQARHDVGVARGFGASLRIGGRFGLWEQFLLRCLPAILDAVPRISVRAEVGLEAELMQGLVQGRLDIAVMYTPESRPGLKVEPLFDEKLVLVSTDPQARPEPGPGYVFIDWGPEFFARHAASFPDFLGAALTANIGWLGLQHVLENGGSGYFPRRLVRPYLRDRRLTVLPSAPDLVLSAYLVHAADVDADVVEPALEAIRRAATAEREVTADTI
ncbi:MAG: LysR family transcriptional regulator [Pseudomonadota bacterium]